METKICDKCKKELPINMFNKDKGGKDGFQHSCRNCVKKYYRKNKEKLTIQSKQYYDNNKEIIKERRDGKKEDVKKYKEDNKENIREYKRKYQEDNRKIIAKYWVKYKIENKDKVNIIKQRRRAKKIRLPNTLTLKQWEDIKVCFDNKCAYCGQRLPLVQEHFLALSKGGEYTNNNIIPSCQSCNSHKYNTDFFEWYPTYKYYSHRREAKILGYLKYDGRIQQLKII